MKSVLRWMLSLLLLAPGAEVAHAQAGYVVLARHAEKSGLTDTASLTPVGQRRATDLAKVLAGTRLDAIISTQYTRTRQTAAPTAGQTALEPMIVDGSGRVPAHAADVARAINALAPGSAVLVVGHSNTLAPIVAALGGPTLADLCELEYSTLLVLERPAPDAPWRFLRARYGAPDPPGADHCHAPDGSMRPGG
ncbi:MAG TPA: histidine phosphatase family protein [Gemmatimonadales bacterium]|nr:histidine phosphatase family protein [Gemmatimonadales bacterium]